MKISVLSENLQKSLSFINHAVSTKTQLPILSYVLLETKEGKLQISATDLEIGIETTVAANVEEEGETLVPAKLFVELVSSLMGEKIVLETKEGKLLVTSKNTKTVLQTETKEEFPILYEEKGEEILSVQGGVLKSVFSTVSFSASADTTRISLTGILVKKEEDGVLFVATDGYRLSMKKRAYGGTTEGQEILEKPLLIPARVIRETNIFSPSEEVKLFVSKKNNQVIFSQETTVLIGRLLEAEFPNYEKIIPTTKSTHVFFDKQEMQKAIKTCAIFAKDAGNIIRFTIKRDMLTVSANTTSVGENTVEIPITLEGEENEIAFNAKYLMDLFANIEAETVVFEMTGPLNPGAFKIHNDASFLHIIMPIRLQS